MLQALDLPLPKRLLAHPHWTVNRRKMSKSVGNVVDPFQAIEEFGADLVRYYLARVGGRFKDDVGELKYICVIGMPRIVRFYRLVK
jgi:methionyl-tRNA synthetase